jgi:hypothetical protein
LLSPLAVRLVQLRDLARRDPELPAQEVLEADVLAVVAAQTARTPAQMTMGAFWKAVAQRGGYVALKARWSSRLENPKVRLASRPNPAQRAFIWLFISVCNVCLKDSLVGAGEVSALWCIAVTTRRRRASHLHFPGIALR